MCMKIKRAPELFLRVFNVSIKIMNLFSMSCHIRLSTLYCFINQTCGNLPDFDQNLNNSSQDEIDKQIGTHTHLLADVFSLCMTCKRKYSNYISCIRT
jgi:uncharacterized protein with PIN domain